MKKSVRALIGLLCIVIPLCVGIFQNHDSVKEAVRLPDITGTEVIELDVEEYYVFSPSFDSCYKQLSGHPAEKIYKGFYAAAQEMPVGYIKLCGGEEISELFEDKSYLETQLAMAYEAMLNDNPEIFWMPSSYKYAVGGRGEKYLAVSFTDGDVSEVGYSMSKYERDRMQKTLDERVEKILSGIPKNADDYAKEKYLNDYICDNTEYVTSGELIDTAYGCLVDGKALCEGYSRAFKLLCNKEGIECDLISGKSQGENHMWNVVNTDGARAYVDVTWNASEKSLRYMYFNITEKQLLHDHELAQFANPNDFDIETNGRLYNLIQRSCTYTGNSYYAKNDLVIYLDYSDEISKIIKRAAKRGEKYVTVMLSDTVAEKFENGVTDCLYDIQDKLGEITIKEYFYDRDILALFFD